MPNPVHIVWFKRDLRIHDHTPLQSACLAGNVLPLYCWEPSQWAGDDYVAQHQVFISECLEELKKELIGIGLQLHISLVGVVETLQHIKNQVPIAGLYSHEETGNGNSFIVDKAVGTWCKAQNINWRESPQNGVVRRLTNRNYWNKHWESRMCAPIIAKPKSALAAPSIILPSGNIRQAKGSDKPRRQRGGRSEALSFFDSFLDNRAAKFRGGISSPLTAVKAGSRLSPYLAYGCLSMREVLQAARERRDWANRELANQNVPHIFPNNLNGGLIGFESRLHWHCHFMQKLESEPEMEFDNLHHAHDGMRDETLNDIASQQRLATWSKGETGWPLIDACMAMLRETGWINFRMRAMLMSTSSYLYWLHWRETGLHLAREFLDYEPGIHWAQTQMQSGTTGINTLRIYSPIIQAQKQDPTGAFVRHWLPALKNVPNTWIFEPYLMPKKLQKQYGCELEKHYPAPLIDISLAMRDARAKILQARKQAGTFDETQAIIKKHASRKGMLGSARDANGQELVAKKRQKKSTLIKLKNLQQELF